MDFCRLSQNWYLKMDLDTHLRDKHAHSFLGVMSYYEPPSILVNLRTRKLHFYQNLLELNSKWDLDTHLGDKCVGIFFARF